MTEAERLHAEAERCRRLAQQSHAGDVRDVLTKMADEYAERACALERGPAGQSQQDLPPQPSRQQQQSQPEPAKEEE